MFQKPNKQNQEYHYRKENYKNESIKYKRRSRVGTMQMTDLHLIPSTTFGPAETLGIDPRMQNQEEVSCTQLNVNKNPTTKKV